MSVETPPTFEQDETYAAEQLRRATMWTVRGSSVGTVSGGVVGTSDCTTAAPVSGMSINLADGELIVPGTVGATQSGYYCFVTSTTNKAIAGSDATNPRIDLVCGTVDDKAYSGSVDDFKIQVVTGTPGGSPVVPSTPASSLSLSNVHVPASATNIITGDITDTRVSAIGAGLTLAEVYPIGSIYVSTVSTNPNTLFGFGTWAAYAAGSVIIGVGTSDQSFSAGATGGESAHTLNTSEIPSHAHGSADGNDFVTTGTSPATLSTGGTPVSGAGGTSTANAGGGASHNNLPPYIVAYIWKRTA